ncbi:NADH-ubiquinone oxidoreductase chain 5 [Legionella steigerwaltii]|uniref:NADH-ubiquinone oxidoreductase chain 5 n=1 Tax=Legionella steigerwaltii TaxID=460 RepID=A0A378L6R1_9GAMM|nr:proton-conducting transporter membrane subunit [Legionella steigerwaltii]KTD80654.1 NADH-ubiquinone oxidoreductase chain 5 [Legionella steigerwaltii]STY22506.1 NADH-ubiquinone oxidoreductase chain 5 [Legionella steigerwaltii]
MNTIILFLSGALLACPTLALFINCFSGRKRAASAARWAGALIGFGFVIGVILLSCLRFSEMPMIYLLTSLNTLALLLCTLVLLVSFIVHRFSLRYMDGDRLYSRYFCTLSAITLSAVVMVLADNLFLFWCSWSLSNLLLIALMVHKSEWTAAKNSGRLAFNTLLVGSISLLAAFILITLSTDTASIQAIDQKDIASSAVFMPAMTLMTLTALTQSAIWPFHRWLISSLNSPTPVSALMHAGLVNGGGILIVKFAPLFAASSHLLMTVFILGTLSAFLGTFWKLMQHDIKKMLACSTLAQMGFMMMQCGLGLFAAAVAHLCWHGLFKAYLFLNSGSVITQKSNEPKAPGYKPLLFLIACSGGFLGMLGFAFMTNKPILSLQATSFLLVFTFIAGAQLMLTVMNNRLSIINMILGLLMSSLAGLIYGASIHLIEALLPNLIQFYFPKLSILHLISLVLLVLPWLLFNLGFMKKIKESNFWCWLYMNLFNQSQPAPKTVTTLRSDYKY